MKTGLAPCGTRRIRVQRVENQAHVEGHAENPDFHESPAIENRNGTAVTEQGSARRHLAGRCTSPESGSFLVVGVGASAGGLEAFRKLLEGLPADTAIVLVLIQHLDPTHESMMVELLGAHTPMKVMQADDGMRLEPNRVYVIPPGANLTVRNGALRLSQPQAPHLGAAEIGPARGAAVGRARDRRGARRPGQA